MGNERLSEERLADLRRCAAAYPPGAGAEIQRIVSHIDWLSARLEEAELRIEQAGTALRNAKAEATRGLTASAPFIDRCVTVALDALSEQRAEPAGEGERE
ncbi:MAG: hypothetical protein ACM33U_08985 [Solirubrobacterales bacterium]|nr:hypothetical protein [Solirubrobacterales bacterium]